MHYAQKITLGEVREVGVRRLLAYCRDHRCSHSVIISADRWGDAVRLSDLEPGKIGLEGIVSKVRDSAYVSGRGNTWVKKTCQQRESLLIAGFALDGDDWDGLYLARHKGKDLVYAGKVDHGFDEDSVTDLRKRLEPLTRKTQPFSKRIAHKGVWVEPRLLAEIEYRAKSAAGKIRHPVFKGLREDL